VRKNVGKKSQLKKQRSVRELGGGTAPTITASGEKKISPGSGGEAGEMRGGLVRGLAEYLSADSFEEEESRRGLNIGQGRVSTRESKGGQGWWPVDSQGLFAEPSVLERGVVGSEEDRDRGGTCEWGTTRLGRKKGGQHAIWG